MYTKTHNIYWYSVTDQSFLLMFCFAPFVSDLGSPKGIRFSDVTDTSATVHWVVPKARVDSYRVTYVPAHGGWCFYVLHRFSTAGRNRLLTAAR